MADKTRRNQFGGGTPQQQPAGDGAEQLREAANRELAENSSRIARALAEKAEKGDSASTKTLVALTKGGSRRNAKQSHSSPIVIPGRIWEAELEKGQGEPATQAAAPTDT